MPTLNLVNSLDLFAPSRSKNLHAKALTNSEPKPPVEAFSYRFSITLDVKLKILQ